MSYLAGVTVCLSLESLSLIPCFVMALVQEVGEEEESAGNYLRLPSGRTCLTRCRGRESLFGFMRCPLPSLPYFREEAFPNTLLFTSSTLLFCSQPRLHQLDLGVLFRRSRRLTGDG